mgnify:CR=1 FL=1
MAVVYFYFCVFVVSALLVAMATANHNICDNMNANPQHYQWCQSRNDFLMFIDRQSLGIDVLAGINCVAMLFYFVDRRHAFNAFFAFVVAQISVALFMLYLEANVILIGLVGVFVGYAVFYFRPPVTTTKKVKKQ